jgi:hypothetical protein
MELSTELNFVRLSTTNDVSHCMIGTHLLNSNLNPFSRIRSTAKSKGNWDGWDGWDAFWMCQT